MTLNSQTEISERANQALAVLKSHANFYKHNILNPLPNPSIIMVQNTNTTYFFSGSEFACLAFNLAFISLFHIFLRYLSTI
jgi:hypothetical protein